MSNQYYNYLADLIYGYMEEELIPGDRYFLRFEREAEIKDMIEAISSMEQSRVFTFPLKDGSVYETTCIDVNGIKLIIASTIGGVTPDFLVTLRNLVGEQTGELWENTALLSFLVGQLDSIEGGSRNLELEGLPLHPRSIFASLEVEIKNSSLQAFEKIILNNSLEVLVKENEIQRVTFLDFLPLFDVLKKESIDDQDYKKFGLFKDSELDTYTGKSQSTRLDENRNFFNRVKEAHEYGQNEEALQNFFSSKGSSELLKDDWSAIPFSDVAKYREDFLKTTKNKRALYQSFSTKEQLTVWDRPQTETAAGKRTRHILIFNPEKLEEINFEASFDLQGDIKFRNQFLDRKSKGVVNASSNKLKGSISKADQFQYLRIRYKHDDMAALGATLFILVLPIQPAILEHVKSKFLINSKTPNQGALVFDYDEKVLVGAGDSYSSRECAIKENEQNISVTESDLIELVPTVDELPDDGRLVTYIDCESVKIPLIFENANDRSVPVKGFKLWHDIRESQTDAKWDTGNDRIIFGHQEYYLDPEYKTYWLWEKHWLDQLPIMHAKREGEDLLRIDLEIGEDLREAYSRFTTIFAKKNNQNNVVVIPSLTAVDDEYRKRGEEYIQAYIGEISAVDNNNISGKKRSDLFKLGTIISNDGLIFTPFHPLMVAFKLELYDQLKQDQVDRPILKRLTPESLIPFVYFPNEGENQLLKSSYTHSVMEWLFFEPTEHISVSDAGLYLAKVVSDKLTQFKKHFASLFMDHSKAPYRINVIEIENDEEVLKGLVNWMLLELRDNGLASLPYMEVTLYRSVRLESAFDLFSRMSGAKEIGDYLDVKFIKVDQYDEDDIARLIQERISYFKKDKSEPYKYAHVAFYKMDPSSHFAIQSSQAMNTGIALEGLSAAVPSMYDHDSGVYKSGFGLKGYDSNQLNLLLNLTVRFNELAANLRNGGNDTYRGNEVILSTSNTIDKEQLSDVLKTAHWVTLVDPIVDLDFFDLINEAVVIHYSDQYSSSSRFDAITLTSRSNQYYKVINDFLKEKNIKGTEQKVRDAVKAFNTFNGEWLLRIIGSKGHYDREKLSIISGIKYTLAYYNHENILWVPISLEEILRIAGAVGLSQTDGVFSARNLGLSGAHSDDLLLLGLEVKDEEYYLHFYPVEVKIGINSSTVIDKATTQVLSTYKGIMEAFEGDAFKDKFYKNFFIELLMSGARRIENSQLWPEKDYSITDEIKKHLLRNEITIGKHLLRYIGKGAVLSFKKEQAYRSVEFSGEVMQITLTEEDGYYGVVRTIDELITWINSGTGDFRRESLLSQQYLVSEKYHGLAEKCEENNKQKTQQHEGRYHETQSQTSTPEAMKNVPLDSKLPNDKETKQNEDDPGSEANWTLPVNNEMPEIHGNVEKQDSAKEEQIPLNAIADLAQKRVKIGKANHSNREIYWEFGHPQLANRHLLISGGSGQGKTYFMQCLLLEQSKLGLSNIVIDYTEGFLPNQLESEFQEFLGDKLKHRLVVTEKLPLNPFRKSVRDVGGFEIPESNTDVAERVKSVFSAVYKNLGIQQQNAIYEAVLEGLETYGDGMSFEKLKSLLDSAGSGPARTALSTIRPLIDRNVFDFDSKMEWDEILSKQGEIYVIQLTSFNRDVQLIITEFILWDLWNYSVQKGSKDRPMPVLMDEAQNLDFGRNSPSGRILTEGRKFGWSAWYATQFLKSQLDADELSRLQNAAQKIYFKPPEQELSNIASALSKDASEKKDWEYRLSNLKKGQCVVHSPILKDNGDLSESVPIIVDIAPLSERI
ncbi:DNA phosphorothioation-dependent restriction protein DptH [Bhargavaea massiliensis]|uniref:DNA phosphorothioation-dependent restriction protein DptH n=1 Tax=Bhargavaea massiliensis TaxID=2697500 RepID=UPI001F00A5ED|nr:DNA phosphorothioation-dependent restriction protein DptH [Bhargavaea massiliensis]